MSNDECKKLSKNEWKKWTAIAGRVLLTYGRLFYAPDAKSYTIFSVVFALN